MNIDIESVETEGAAHPPLPGWVTLPEAAERLGVSKQAVHKMVNNGELSEVYSVGKKLLVVAEHELTAFIKLRVARYGSKQGSVVVSTETMSV